MLRYIYTLNLDVDVENISNKSYVINWASTFPHTLKIN